MIPGGIDESTDGKKPIISLALNEGGRSFQDEGLSTANAGASPLLSLS